MQHNARCKHCGMGRLPALAPLANPYVPFQREDPIMYDPAKALIRGTLYEGLDLPFKGMVNNRQLTTTPLTRLQTLSFVIQELALYLDTHRDNKEAFAIYKNFQMMYEKAKCEYEKKYGPLNHMSPAPEEYRWLDDPWPWEYSKNREV